MFLDDEMDNTGSDAGASTEDTGADAGASTEDTGAESTGEETPAAEENAEGGEEAGM